MSKFSHDADEATAAADDYDDAGAMTINTSTFSSKTAERKTFEIYFCSRMIGTYHCYNTFITQHFFSQSAVAFA